MSINLSKDLPLDPVALTEAFERFTDASTRLEERYARLQQETEDLREQLREKDLEVKHAERLSVLGEMAAAIAHEVRNPLGAMKLFLSVLADEVQDRPEALVLVKQMNTSIATLDHVVSNILQFSKVHQAQLFAVNLHALIREQVAQMQVDRGHVSFDLVIVGSPFIHGNEHGLRQVFSNILLNACQAMKNQGTITLRVRELDDGGQIVTIADSGPGIPEAIIDRVFEPFVTSKNEGTGLGLAIVRQILAHHGAEISVRNRSQLGSPGTEFTICFPKINKELSGR